MTTRNVGETLRHIRKIVSRSCNFEVGHISIYCYMIRVIIFHHDRSNCGKSQPILACHNRSPQIPEFTDVCFSFPILTVWRRCIQDDLKHTRVWPIPCEKVSMMSVARQINVKQKVGRPAITEHKNKTFLMPLYMTVSLTLDLEYTVYTRCQHLLASGRQKCGL